MPCEIKAVLFDIDDTLFNRELAQKLTLDLIIAKHPTLLGAFSPAKLASAWAESDVISTVEFNSGGFIRSSRCRHFLRLLGLPLELTDELTAQYLTDYPALNVPLAGALELLCELKKHLKIGVVSNSLADVQITKIKTLGISDLLSCTVLSEDLGIRKPDPRVFQYVARLLQVEASQCLFVGDSFSADIIGAKSATMQACWLQHGNRMMPENPLLQPDYIIHSLSELLPLLKNDGLIK
jgi:putative hydrolase of the HAD superfamily